MGWCSGGDGGYYFRYHPGLLTPTISPVSRDEPSIPQGGL